MMIFLEIYLQQYVEHEYLEQESIVVCFVGTIYKERNNYSEEL